MPPTAGYAPITTLSKRRSRSDGQVLEGWCWSQLEFFADAIIGLQIPEPGVATPDPARGSISRSVSALVYDFEAGGMEVLVRGVRLQPDREVTRWQILSIRDQNRARLRVDDDVEAVLGTVVDDDVEAERGGEASAREPFSPWCSARSYRNRPVLGRKRVGGCDDKVRPARALDA